MVWGCMGWNRVGKLVEVQGKMNAEQYCQILKDDMEESFEKLEMKEEECYFQQDNDPKHTSKQAKKKGFQTKIFKYWSGLHNPLT